jgi:hypothetical protein
LWHQSFSKGFILLFQAGLLHCLKVIHRDISSAYFFLIVDLRERGTLLQQKNGLKKSQAQNI